MLMDSTLKKFNPLLQSATTLLINSLVYPVLWSKTNGTFIDFARV